MCTLTNSVHPVPQLLLRYRPDVLRISGGAFFHCYSRGGCGLILPCRSDNLVRRGALPGANRIATLACFRWTRGGGIMSTGQAEYLGSGGAQARHFLGHIGARPLYDCFSCSIYLLGAFLTTALCLV